MTHLRQIMLEELERRNYAPWTIRSYIRAVEHFEQHFGCSPDELGLDHIRRYQVEMFRTWKLAPNSVTQRLATHALATVDYAVDAAAGQWRQRPDTARGWWPLLPPVRPS